MSQPSRPQAQGPAQRRRRGHQIEAVLTLEERCLLAPVVSLFPRLAAFTAITTLPTGTNSRRRGRHRGQPDRRLPHRRPVHLGHASSTPTSSFGGDIVRIRSGPGGDFGKGVYAISRGAGENAGTSGDQTTTSPTVTGAINRPGVIYRVDPATGKTSVFFDLNTVVSQLDPARDRRQLVGNADRPGQLVRHRVRPRGLLRRPAVDVRLERRPLRPDQERGLPDRPRRHVPGGVRPFTDGAVGSEVQREPERDPRARRRRTRPSSAACSPAAAQGRTTREPLGPLLRRQRLLPGQNLSTGARLPTGVDPDRPGTPGPITGLTASNPDYLSRVYSTFTDFGTPAAPGIEATTGLQRRPGDQRRAPHQRRRLPGAHDLAATSTDTHDHRPLPRRDERLPPVRGHRLRPVRLLLPGGQHRRRPATNHGSDGGPAPGPATAAQAPAVTAPAAVRGGTGTGGGSTGGTGAGGGSGSGVGQSLGAGIAGTVIDHDDRSPASPCPRPTPATSSSPTSAPGCPCRSPSPNTTPAQTIRVPVQGPESSRSPTSAATSPTTVDPRRPRARRPDRADHAGRAWSATSPRTSTPPTHRLPTASPCRA